MAKARKTAQADLPAQRDPAAPLDAAAFLRAAQPVLRRLTEDLLVRADASTHVTAALKTKHTEARAQHRTAEDYVVWRRAVVTQVAAAWLLSCVFIRVLEDRGLIHARLAGAAASDSERTFFQFAPSLSHREYLLMTFRELTRLPAAAELFDSKHNLVWRLAPSDAACKDLLQLFRGPSIEAPAFRFGQLDTRFLGDLYQDIDKDTREFYALLQTPDFVESFILDHTLEPAIREYGIDNADLIDPTCGSGHFLLGAFPRFLDHLRRAHPAMDDRELARRALDKIFGVDINPYAASIARFRLFLKFVEVGQYRTLRETPKPPIHVVPADSLLYGFAGGQGDLSEREEKYGSDAFGEGFNLEDAKGAREILGGRTYTAVVGNPPYITVKDAALREKYRDKYTAASGKYALSAPFMQRFFALGKGEGGYVGQITSNSFTKREFGKALIERVLREIELTYIVNTGGAFIPGHGTPTVIVFGRNRKLDLLKDRGSVLAVLAKRGEAGIPDIPAQGGVWRSIVDHGHEVGFDNEYISVDYVDRFALDHHPWALEGGGAGKLKERIEACTQRTLGATTEAVGFDAIMGEDEFFISTPNLHARLGIPIELRRSLVEGEGVRDWAVESDQSAIFPYDAQLNPSLPNSPAAMAFFWTFRKSLTERYQFGKSIVDAGLAWFEYRSFYKSKRFSALSITYAEVATHNHFVIDRGGKVFKQTAPIIKLPLGATEGDYLALAAYLNSSTACFWLKQVSYPKGMHNGSEANSTPFLVRFAFDGSKLKQLPLPPAITTSPYRDRLVALARDIDGAQTQRKALTFAAILSDHTDTTVLAKAVDSALSKKEQLLYRAIAKQEEIDWITYFICGLIKEEISMDDVDYEIAPGERAFEIRLAQDDPTSITEGWFRWSQVSPVFSVPQRLPSAIRAKMQVRIEAIHASKELRILESPVNKRRWRQPAGKAAQELETDAKVFRDQAEEWLADRLETHVRYLGSTTSTRRHIIDRAQQDAQFICVLSWLDPEADPRPRIALLLDFYSVPFIAGYRYSAAGREKYALWLNTWHLQRQADVLDYLAEKSISPHERQSASAFRSKIAVPPRYEPEDFRDGNCFRLRGKLDVPRERFISYPSCASNDDLEPVYGWAGWDHLQRALALFQLFYSRKDEPGAHERLLPMLAGLEELLPWVRQWHAEARSPETGQLYHEYFDQVIASEAAELGFSRAQLATWAPPERGAGRKSAKATPSSADDSDPDAPTTDGESPTPKRKPGRKPKAAVSSDGSDADAAATDTEPAAPRRKPGRKPKAPAATDASDPAPARARKSKSADKTPPSASE